MCLHCAFNADLLHENICDVMISVLVTASKTLLPPLPSSQRLRRGALTAPTSAQRHRRALLQRRAPVAATHYPLLLPPYTCAPSHAAANGSRLPPPSPHRAAPRRQCPATASAPENRRIDAVWDAWHTSARSPPLTPPRRGERSGSISWPREAAISRSPCAGRRPSPLRPRLRSTSAIPQ